ncbi:MAG: extracellular solute-binding protein [Clostridia bacterium]|nr:extracellular solute-binding protein [Clostridia bacterium]
MKKLLALVLSAIMALSMVSFAAAEGDTVLKIVGWDINTTAYYAAQKEAFEATHPGITIEYIDVSSQDYGTKASTMLAGGDTSDIFMVKAVPDILNWYNAGYAEPLNPYMEKDNYDVSGFVGMETGYRYDDVQAALPFRSDFWVLFYNKTLFDNAGVPYPTNDMTWEQYKDLAIKMTDSEKGIYGAHYHTWLSAVVNWAVDDGVNTLVDGDYEDLKYFYELYFALEDAGAIMPYPEVQAAGLHYSGAFGNGNIAMMPMGYWYVATLISNIQNGTYNVSDWGITAVPHKEDVPAGSSFGNLTGVMINKASANKDAAWTYAAWLCGAEGAAVTAGTGNRPAWVSEDVANVMASVEGFPADENSKAALLPSMVSIELPGHPKASEINTILSEEHSAIITREIDIEEGILNMNDRVAEVLAQ